ncbi:unnamed protein product [Ostreobium quekettii]|uniref:indole-3-pyruvate monooxygenase n=1 Tax=Ostreobium quekettii TaxID=121088 RepID=A0A8S1IWB3_9CHLO|nr:unnamed protein product [Ostreobium quekettii]
MSAPTHEEQRRAWLDAFASALERRDVDAAASLFADECYWRDLVAFTWNLVTLEGRDAVAAMLTATLPAASPRGWAAEGDAIESAEGVVEGRFNFETGAARCKGHVRLRGGRCWTLTTTMDELIGHEERRGRRRETGRCTAAGTKSVGEVGDPGWQPYCLVVGGGQGGITVGARLGVLGVPVLVVDRLERPGDAWRRRYACLVTHDPVHADHLPYMPFPDHWPVFSTKDRMGDWLEAYATVMGLNYWGSTECRNAVYDEEGQRWTVTLNREGKEVKVYPTHVVLATGLSGAPKVPEVPGAATFVGLQQHSSEFSSGKGWEGKRCVVVGAGNSALDICGDLWAHGAQVTMVQRSATLVVQSQTLTGRMLGKWYSEEAVEAGVTHEMADFAQSTVPYRLMPARSKVLFDEIRAANAEFYDGLSKAGFLLTFGPDGSGMPMRYLRRAAGSLIDTGNSELIASGKVRLKSGVEISNAEADALVLNDGTRLPADLVVYATGYGNMSEVVAKLLGQGVADRIGRVWGMGSGLDGDPGPWEGELRNMWKPTRQPGLWIHAGMLALSRTYSRYLALQIKARFEGIPTPVYGLAEVHHKR